MGRLFGTDGVRGVANTELNCELAMNLGRAAALVLTEETHHRPRILIGKDTRISSDMLEAAMTAGICSVGADALVLGFVPTPAVAYLVRNMGADAGIMISASHNPMEYNGIKIFNGSGYKLSDKLEEKIEAIVIDKSKAVPIKAGAGVGRVIKSESAVEDYIEHLKATSNTDLTGLMVAVDCANGSSSATARRVFEETGAKFYFMSEEPDGVNINKDCGSTHLEKLREFMKNNSDYDIGVAFDGDADRCLAVDENGEIIDGDKLIAIFAESLKEQGRLKSDTAVVTVMSNFGFFKFAEENGIKAAKTKVGDRYVLEKMMDGGFVIGGEQSGHIIFLDYASTGDGELTALQLLSILKKSGKKASELAKVMECYPQVMVNVKVSSGDKNSILALQDVKDAIAKAASEIADDGRIVVRASGTEPLIRVMVEGKNLESIQRLADGVAAVVKSHL